MRNIFLKTIYDKRWFILGWTAGMAFFAYLMVAFFPTFKPNGLVQSMFANMPKELQGLIGNLQDMTHLSTYLAGQLFNIRMPMFISVMAIILAGSLTAGEEDKGLTRTLSALPVSRGKIYAQKWLGAVVICAITLVGLIVGTYIGSWQIGESIEFGTLMILNGLLLLLMVAFVSLIFAIGTISGKRSFTTGIGTIVAALSFVLTTFATSVDWLKPWDRLSIFHYFPAPDIARGTVKLSYWAVYAGLIVVSLTVSYLIFRRRDLKG